ncbi:hypothetical protein TNCV_4126291 [Trichonephila clavipes]|nr:hypothetical protein TNCV_4126291 [Trichonephila clavipes]
MWTRNYGALDQTARVCFGVLCANRTREVKRDFGDLPIRRSEGRGVVMSSKAELSFPFSTKCFLTLKGFCKLAADFPEIVSLILKCSTIELDKQREVFLPPFVVTLGLCGDLSSSSNSLQMHFATF